MDFPHKPSDRVSLSPQFLKYNPVTSAGVNVGYNAVEQTAGPGECIKYLWHADKEYGTVLLSFFGDPATPVFRSYVGERIIIRLLMPADKPRNISFLIHGHRWRAQPDDPFTRIIPVQGAISVGNVFNIEPERTKCPGDYLYRSGSLRWDVESGMWGILRVSGRNIKCRCESMCRSVKQWWEKKWYDK